MSQWQPTPEQNRQFAEDGYFIQRNVIPRDLAIELRGIIKNTILLPEPDSTASIDPMDPMGDTPAARAARFRKLGRFCSKSPLIWHSAHAGAPMLDIVRHFKGDNIVVKFDSCFLKPAKTGSATPWHQDNGLWRDGESEPFNFWMALDPATRANGCLQVIPGSHNGEIVPHVLYEDSIHGELPHGQVATAIERHGVDHIELESGDVVCWHSNLWHYSPPNTSDQGRIAIAGVYTTPEIIDRGKPYWRNLLWAMRDGQCIETFPPEPYPVDESRIISPPPYGSAGERT